MKVIKPQKLGIITRVFENGPECYFTVSLLVFFSFDAPSALLPEVALWKLVGKELGKEGVLDMGMPKPRAEVLVDGSAYTPGGAPRIGCSVRARVGTIDKSLYVVGDRHWKLGGVASDPEPFTEMRLGWDRAFGGPGYAQNPLGKGFAPAGKGEMHPLPNIELPKQLVRAPGDRPPPAGFGAYDQTWPQRFSKIGTYDQEWLKERFPGLAKDLDPTFFNAAPDDQQIDGYFRGDEVFALENLHPSRPLVEGALPGVQTRAFVTQKTAEGDVWKAIPTRLDTVRLFPHAERGILIFRGLLKVAEDDGADIVNLLIACEDMGAPKPVEHYQKVLAQRLDREKAHLFGFKDSDLMPAPRPGAPSLPEDKSDMTGLIEMENLHGKAIRRKAEREREQTRAAIAALGLDPAKHEPPALPPEESPPDLENLEVFVDQLNTMAEEQKKAAEKQKADSMAQSRAICAEHGIDFDKVFAESSEDIGGPPQFSAREEMDKLRAIREEFVRAGNTSPELDRMLVDPALRERLEAAEIRLRDAYKQSAHVLSPARRMKGPRVAEVRAEVLAAVEKKESLAGRDLTGADLSGLDLSGVDLREALLECVDFHGAKLAGADLTGAVLARADLSDVDLDGAKLAGANIGGAVLARTRLRSADLSGAVLYKATLDGADLEGAELGRADLLEAVWKGCNLRAIKAKETIFFQGDLTGMSFAGADLEKCTFLEVTVIDADFDGCKMGGAVFVGARGDRAHFRGASAPNLRLVKDCSFPEADFSGATLTLSNFRETKLGGASFEGAKLENADLSGCDLSRARLARIEAPEARFIRTDLGHANVTAANLMNAILQKATIEAADFTGANLFRADLAKVKGKAHSVKDANLVQVRFVARRDA
ncbi:MAG: DUF2169 domain-containing protein [Byssovorax sp.]